VKASVGLGWWWRRKVECLYEQYLIIYVIMHSFVAQYSKTSASSPYQSSLLVHPLLNSRAPPVLSLSVEPACASSNGKNRPGRDSLFIWWGEKYVQTSAILSVNNDIYNRSFFLMILYTLHGIRPFNLSLIPSYDPWRDSFSLAAYDLIWLAYALTWLTNLTYSLRD